MTVLLKLQFDLKMQLRSAFKGDLWAKFHSCFFCIFLWIYGERTFNKVLWEIVKIFRLSRLLLTFFYSTNIFIGFFFTIFIIHKTCYLKSLDPNLVRNATLCIYTFISSFLLLEFKNALSGRMTWQFLIALELFSL